MLQGQNGFEELRRYIKQGGDFCKDLSSILQERYVSPQRKCESYSSDQQVSHNTRISLEPVLSQLNPHYTSHPYL
jgi:hypothetical protein